jgi:transcriptional regulator with XRE-family HTH domain
MALGDRVRRRRAEKGITAAELARRAGISKGYLSDIENSESAPRPSADVLFRLASALGTNVADLLERPVQPIQAMIPQSLLDFANEAKLPEEDIQMLGHIQFRGGQPSTVDDWRFLYESIKRSIRPKD